MRPIRDVSDSWRLRNISVIGLPILATKLSWCVRRFNDAKTMTFDCWTVNVAVMLLTSLCPNSFNQRHINLAEFSLPGAAAQKFLVSTTRRKSLTVNPPLSTKQGEITVNRSPKISPSPINRTGNGLINQPVVRSDRSPLLLIRQHLSHTFSLQHYFYNHNIWCCHPWLSLPNVIISSLSCIFMLNKTCYEYDHFWTQFFQETRSK